MCFLRSVQRFKNGSPEKVVDKRQRWQVSFIAIPVFKPHSIKALKIIRVMKIKGEIGVAFL